MNRKIQKKKDQKKHYKSWIEPIVKKNNMFGTNIYHYLIM